MLTSNRIMHDDEAWREQWKHHLSTKGVQLMNGGSMADRKSREISSIKQISEFGGGTGYTIRTVVAGEGNEVTFPGI